MKQLLIAGFKQPAVQVAIGLAVTVAIIAILWASLYVTGLIVLTLTDALHGDARMWAIDSNFAGKPSAPGPISAAIGFLFAVPASVALATFGLHMLYDIGKAVTGAFGPAHAATSQGRQ